MGWNTNAAANGKLDCHRRGLDAVGRAAPQLHNRSHGHQGHLAGAPVRAWCGSARSAKGYSSPAVENGVLYTMYGKRGEEVVLAANAETGETLWEHATPMTFVSDAAREMGNGPVLDAAHRRRSRLHDRRRRTAAVLRQEDRQGAVDAAALGRPSRLASDVRLRVEPDRVSRHRDRAGRRPRQGGDGVQAGRRQGRLEPQRFRQRLFVAAC